MKNPSLFDTAPAPAVPVESHRALRGAVRRAFESAPAAGVVRVSVDAAGIEPLAWLAAQPRHPHVYWAGRDDERRVAAVGAALSIRAAGPGDPAFRRAVRRLRGSGARFYGGFRFDADYPTPEPAWRAFGSGRFVLPRFELVAAEGRTRLVCNLAFPEDRAGRAAILADVAALAEPAALARALPLPIDRRDAPGAGAWRASVAWALDAFEREVLAKVVLARRATYLFAEAIRPEALLARLEAATPGCFHYLFAFDADAAFVGASPERLYRRDGRAVRSEAVAGTRPRGASAADDARLRAELLASDKDRREHAVVLDRIGDALRPLTVALDADADPSALTLARKRHLYAAVEGILADAVTDADVLAALSPTPAVGGDPRPAALAAIRAREPFDRGWYAGPVGWVGDGEAEFAVAIRSGLLTGDALALYSGAGVVAGSVPTAEWDEIEHKISDFTAVLGLDDRRG